MSGPALPPPPASELRLLLVDDHPLVRDGLRARLQAVPGLAVVAEADTGQAALAAVASTAVDVVLMDIALRGDSGIEATRRLCAAQPGLRVIMLSMHEHAHYVRAAVAAGASGYVLKDSPAAEIVAAIAAVAAGGRHFGPSVAAALEGDASPSSAAAAERRLAGLTPREREVLALIALGLSSRDIGQRLAMGVRTVETHRSSLRRKLDLASPAALVRFAVSQQQRAPPP